LKLYAPKPRKFAYAKRVLPLCKNSVNSEETDHEEEFSCPSDIESTKTIEVNLNNIGTFYKFEKELNKSIEEEEIRTEIAGILQKEFTDNCTLNNCKNITNQILKYENFKGGCLPRPKNPIYIYFDNTFGDKTS
jgi:hypothetical protein